MSFGNQDFRCQVVVVRIILVANGFSIVACQFVVAHHQRLACFEDVGQCGVRIYIQGTFYSLGGLVTLAVVVVVVGQVDKVVGIHKGLLSCLECCLVALEQLFEIF